LQGKRFGSAPVWNYLVTQYSQQCVPSCLSHQLTTSQHRGSAMTGGSSGGPWVVNYGVDASLNGVNYGSNNNRYVIVVSWGRLGCVTGWAV
jgi:hypothetical protein